METQLIGIPQAIDAEQVAITRAAIDLGEYTKPLRCGGCKAPVKAVPSHRRGTSRVAAHFSLISRENNDHDDECIYHFDERLGELIEEIRHEVEKNETTYRLLLRAPALYSNQSFNTPSPNDSLRQRMDVIKPVSGWKIHPSLQSAMAINRLLKRFDDDPDATDLFRAKFNDNEELTWNEFYFDLANDTHKLWESLAKDSESPRAVTGVIQWTRESHGNTSGVAEFEPVQHDDITYDIELRSENRLFLPKKNQTIISYGRWLLGEPQKNT